jgi:MATE family multidrug resistance protein
MPQDLESRPLLVEEEQEEIEEPQVEWAAIRKECDTLFSMAWPVIGTYVISYVNNVAPLLTLGHLSTKYLAAISLATMTANITGFSIGFGLNSALDTLCSQAFTGSDDPKALGKHLQRGIVISFLLAIPVLILWAFCEPILLLLHQDPEVARLSGIFIRWLMPGLIPQLLYNCILRYLQGQRIMKASFYISLVCVPINVALQYLLVHGALAIGPEGAPIATSITYFLNFIMIGFYAAYFEGYETWGGWSMNEAFDMRQLYIFLSLGIPGVMMTCSEWWAFEVVALLAGILGDQYLAAQTIILNTCGLTYMVPMGLAIATSTRVGNSLGANLPYTTRNVAISGYIIGFVLASFNCIALLLVRNVWGYVYSNDETVVKMVADVLPMAAFFQLNDGLGALGGGILRGCGRQNLGAYLNLSAYYIFGLPIGAFFTFYLSWGLSGIWAGLSIGILICSFSQLYIILWTTNWPEMASKALALVRTHSSSSGLV